jgi:hypothetical protein
MGRCGEANHQTFQTIKLFPNRRKDAHCRETFQHQWSKSRVFAFGWEIKSGQRSAGLKTIGL